MQVEKVCPYCKKIFLYEDGISEPLFTNTGDRSEDFQERRAGYCPNCVDPYAIPGYSHSKRTILTLFKDLLLKNGVKVEYIDDDTLITLLPDFPRLHTYYKSNGTYLTFNLPPNSLFDGEFGQFELGTTTDKEYREILCKRCNATATYNSTMILRYYFGIEDKRCVHCDAAQYIGNHPRNTSGLMRNGSSKSQYSERAIAKALNVSRNDLRRYKITSRQPSLPLNTVVNGLRIEEAFWEEETMTPKYRLVCDECQDEFFCTQKHIHRQQHFCPKVYNVD